MAPDTVLTAAHCVLLSNGAGLVPAADVEVQAWWGTGQASAISALVDRYQDLGDLVGRDLAIIRLRQPSSATVFPLAAPTPRHGSVHASRFVDGHVRIQPAEILLRDTAVVYTTPTTCDGDSGGALVDESGNVLAVSSWRSDDCGLGSSVFTRLDVHNDWLLAEGVRMAAAREYSE